MITVPLYPGNIVFCCNPNNDLYTALKDSEYEFKRDTNLENLIKEAENETGILILADYYPRQTVEIGQNILNMAEAKNLRLYIEYPLSLEGLNLGEPSRTKYERLVVSSDFFKSKLEKDTIMMLNGCWYLPVTGVEPHLCMAKAAGYSKIVYGLPEKVFPILFQMKENENILVSSSCLSNFITARYAPYVYWKNLWEYLLGWISRGEYTFNLKWEPGVGPTYKKNDVAPADLEISALQRSFSWFRNHAVYSVDPKKGAIEGFESGIDHMGRQMIRNVTRSDCVSESAMVLALDWHLNKDPDKKYLSKEILDYVWSPVFFQGDPNSPMYGLNNWYENGPVFYGDDNARVIMATLLARSIIDTDRWDERVLKCLLANLRTTNKLGFRYNRLEYSSFLPKDRSWSFYMNDDEYTSYSPHYQAYLWAAYIWAYSLTGYNQFLDISKNALRMCMEVYPEKWYWTNSLTAEISRIILPLAFLVRVEDTQEYREWLYRAAGDLLKYMDESGAIQDMFGELKNGKYPPPQSNDNYGTTEASLIQNNGDPATDLLYTTNWAFLGLHEAAIATGDKLFKEAEDRLAEFLCRIQVKSEYHKYLDGAWMRSFDFKKWEYWGSSADIGWGAWCVESGWVNSWIACVLAMRHKRESIFNLAAADKFKKISPVLIEEMFTEKSLPLHGSNKGNFVSSMPGAE